MPGRVLLRGVVRVDGLPGLIVLALDAGGRGVRGLEAQFNKRDRFGEQGASLGGLVGGEKEGVETSFFNQLARGFNSGAEEVAVRAVASLGALTSERSPGWCRASRCRQLRCPAQIRPGHSNVRYRTVRLCVILGWFARGSVRERSPGACDGWQSDGECELP